MADSGDGILRGHELKIALLSDGLCRVDYGDERGGRYVIAAYEQIADYVISRKPRLELLDIYPSLRGNDEKSSDSMV